MKRIILIFFGLISVQIFADKLISAPFIKLDKERFMVYTPYIENDSIVTQESKMMNDKESYTVKIQDISFEVPIYTHLVNPLDTLKTEEDIFVVSDIEGNFSAFYNLLLKNKIIDKACNWTFGKGQLVIDGDMVDRGEFVNECLYLLYKLDYQSIESGGRVHYLLGNHDVMLMTGDHRYVNQKYQYISNSFHKTITELYDVQTLLGRWMRSKNTMIKINELLFVHAGISLDLIEERYQIEEINNLIRVYLNTNNKDARTMFILKSKGPLWYRGLVSDNKTELKLEENQINKILSYFSVDKIIIGHTIVDSISFDYNKKVMRVDVDHNDMPQGLLIKKKHFYRADLKSGLTEL